MIDVDRDRAQAIFDAAGKLAKRLERKGFSRSEITACLASYGIATGIRIDGPHAWAGALADHARRVEEGAKRLEDCARMQMKH